MQEYKLGQVESVETTQEITHEEIETTEEVKVVAKKKSTTK